MKRVFLLFVIAYSCISQGLYAQKVAVKTNLLSDAVLNPNLGIEVGLAPKWTLDVTGQCNTWETVARQAVEALGYTTRNSLLAMRPFQCALFWISSAWRSIQHRRLRWQNQLLGNGCPKTEGFPLSRLVRRHRCRLWLRVDSQPPLELRGGGRFRLFLHPL